MRYILGNGKTAITKGNIDELDIPFIRFEVLKNDKLKVGADLIESEEIAHTPTTIVIKNLEGLAVLEYMIKAVKKQLKKQNKKL